MSIYECVYRRVCMRVCVCVCECRCVCVGVCVFYSGRGDMGAGLLWTTVMGACFCNECDSGQHVSTPYICPLLRWLGSITCASVGVKKDSI